MRGINSSKLTKQVILDKVSQSVIMATYLGIPISVVENCIKTGELICNPLREDVHPTAGFRYNNKGKLKFKDFGNDYFWGDCFDIVALIMTNMYKKTYDVSNKEDFIKILRHITFTFKNIFYGQEKDINLINSINNTITNLKHQKPIIELVIRSWNEYDKRYWGNIGVSLQFLNINFIYAVEQYYINRKINPEPKYFYNTEDPCYAYHLGQDRSGINNIKLYFPNRKKSVTRFITNCNHLEGIYNLDKSDYDIIVITKSTKDRVSMGAAIIRMYSLYGGASTKIGFINVPHETYKLRQNEYDWLKSKLVYGGKIASLMDNDTTGKHEAIWLRNSYNIIPILIPIKYGAKDFAELVSKHKFADVVNLINQAIKYINNYVRENNKFSWDSSKWDNTLPY